MCNLSLYSISFLIAERARLLPMVIFIFIWSTLVYNPVASWTWNANGWSAKLGAIDYAGGVSFYTSIFC